MVELDPARAAEAQRLRAARRALAVLVLANVLNYADRVIPAIVIEPIATEFGLNDLQIGLLGAAGVVVFAIAGLPLGRLADRRPRMRLMAVVLLVWSGFTAATAASWNYLSLLVARIGVGIGEAGYAPAANSVIGDLFRPAERARASGVFMLGLPLGVILAYATVGAIAEALGGWRAPFLVAAVPGLLVAVLLFRLPEPRRGAADDAGDGGAPVERAFARILAVPTMWWLVLAGIGYNSGAYAVGTFTVPLMQRWFGLSLTGAATASGVIVGITGLVALTAGGALGDRAYRRSPRARVLLGACAVLVAAPLTAAALRLDRDAAVLFTALFALGWLLGYLFVTTVYPAVADVIEPQVRATAIALLFALQFLLGGAAGPLLVGAVSDARAAQAVAAGADQETARAAGLHDALLLVPASLLLTGLALLAASATISRDTARMRARLTA